MRIKLTIEYNGPRFFGWQKQDGFASVQETVENAISKVFNDSETIELYGAGRTDTGVHATGQVAHFDILLESTIEKWENNIAKLPMAINFYLIDSGAVVTSAELPSSTDFHARFSAKMRHYQYIIFNRRIRSVIHNELSWHVPNRLDETAMHNAAQLFIGTHNLNAFRSAHCNAKNPVRTISSLTVKRKGDFITIDISARSFLHNQVRIIVGTLKQIGEGKIFAKDIEMMLTEGNRTKSGPTAPPHGLYLTKIEY